MTNRTKYAMARLVVAFMLTFGVTFGGQVSLLEAASLQQETGTVNRDSNVRSGPGVDFDVVSVFAEGTAVEIVGTSDDGEWYELSGGEWIATFLVDRASSGDVPVVQPATEESAEAPADEEATEEAPTEPTTESAAPATGASAAAIVARDGNLRSGPSTLYDVTRVIEAGETVILVGQTPYGNWFLTEDGDWISISVIAAPPAPLPNVEPNDENTVAPTAPAADEEAMEEEAPADEEAMEEEAPADEEAMEEEAPADEEAMEEEAPADEEAMEEMPEPQVTIPSGWKKVADETRGYSLALPPGWAELDLRGAQFAQLATTFGQGAAVADLQEFLATAEGQAVGVVAITDIANTFFGGLPTLLNVSIIEAPGATPELVVNWLEEVVRLNESQLGDVNLDEIMATTVNNLPAVVGSGTGDLSSVGVGAEAFVKAVGLIANDKIYLLTLGTQAANMARYEVTFDGIIGTFRPE